jgi:hypothetical protein
VAWKNHRQHSSNLAIFSKARSAKRRSKGAFTQAKAKQEKDLRKRLRAHQHAPQIHAKIGADMADEVKPGYRTTEFWVTLIGQAVALGVVFGIVQPQDQGTIADAASKAVQGVFALIVSGATILSYISARVRLKDK